MYWSRTLLMFVAMIATTTIAFADVADDDFRVATRQFERKRWAPAATELAAFLEDHRNDPRAADARYLLAESLVQLRRYPEAREQLVQFLRQTDQHRYTRLAEFRAAEAAFHAANHAVARSELEAFRDRYPNDTLLPHVLTYLGELALLDRDGATAKARFTQVLDAESAKQVAGASSPLVARCNFGLAQAHEQSGNVAESLRLFREVADASYRYAGPARFRMAMLHYGLQEFAEAETLLKELAAPEDDLVTSHEGDNAIDENDARYEAQYWLGMARLGQQSWSTAVTALEEGLNAIADHRLAHARRFALAEALRHDGRLKAAKLHLHRVFELVPPCDWSDDAGQILVQLAFEAESFPDVDSLASRFHEWYPASPLSDNVRQLQGRAMLKQQNFDGAISLFEQLLGANDVPDAIASRADDDPSPQTAANEYYLAIAYLGANRPADALRVLPASDSDGVSAELSDGIRMTRASAMLALGNYEQAITTLQDYVVTHTSGADGVDSHAKLIVALAETGRWYEAVESFDVFRQRHPRATALYSTAQFLADLALAHHLHDVAEPLYTFLTGDDVSAKQGTVNDHDNANEAAEPTTGPRTTRQWMIAGLNGIARSQFERGLYRDTVKTTARLLSQAPTDSIAAEALLLQGRAFESDGETEQAVESYELIFNYDPMCEQASTALFNVSRIYSHQGSPDAARRQLEQLVRQHPNFVQRDGALYQLAWLCMEAGDIPRADQCFAALVTDYPQSPLWTDAVFRLARNAANRQDARQANDWLSELLAGVARRPAVEQAAVEQAAMNRNVTHHTDAGAVVAGQTVSHQPPSDGSTERQGIRQDDATSSTRSTPAADEDQIVCHALYLQGKLAVDARDWLSALQSYHRIVEEYPLSELAEAAAFWSAEAYYHLEQFELAEVMLRRQIDVTFDEGSEIQAMIPLRLAQCAVHRQQWQDALELARRISEIAPMFSLQFEVDYLMGRCLTSQARFAMARQSFRRVVNSASARGTETAAMAQWMIGETYFHQSNYDDAIRAYYRVDALYDIPHWSAAALLQAAKCHELNGQGREAQQLYGQLQSEFPQTPFAVEAAKRLRVATRNRRE